MLYKEILSFIAVVLTFIAFLPYIQSVRKGITKPHIFSWIIWTVATITVFFAQLADGGGVGALSIGISGVITLYVAILAYLHKGDFSITRWDWTFFFSALLSLPLWYITSDPLWSVIILTLVDTLGFLPTFRKAYYRPHEESAAFFSIVTVRNIITTIALENYSVTTMLFPVTIAGTCILFIIMVMYRRKIIQTET